MSFAPLSPKFRQRRSVYSVGEPSRLASQPSIGWMHQRLPTSNSGNRHGLGERRAVGGGQDLVINGQRQAELGQPRAEGGDTLKLGDFGVVLSVVHASSLNEFSKMAEAPRYGRQPIVASGPAACG